MDFAKNTGQQLGEKEKLFLKNLEELNRLNNVGLGHTQVFKQSCSQKKREVKNNLNDLIKQLRREGSKHPEIVRYM